MTLLCSQVHRPVAPQCLCNSAFKPVCSAFHSRPAARLESTGHITSLARCNRRSQVQLGQVQAPQCHTRTVCRAQKQEEKEKDIVGGIDVNQEGDIWEGEFIGNIVKIVIVLLISGAVAAILLLARPVIDNTVRAFPYRSSTNNQAEQSQDKSLIPGLDSVQDDGGLFD